MSDLLLQQLQLKPEGIPHHVGFILDGNRRWAKANNLSLIEGYKIGAQKTDDILRWALESGIKVLSIWVWSTENFRRATMQVSFMMKLFKSRLKEALNESVLKKYDVRVSFLGDLEKMPQEIQKMAVKLENQTKEASSLQLNICMGYGGRQEITNACKLIARDVLQGRVKPDQVDEGLVQEYMYYNGVAPDLIIRTGGEQRSSGFLMWHAAYSEYYFAKKLLPDFSREDFFQALLSYQERSRRYGS